MASLLQYIVNVLKIESLAKDTKAALIVVDMQADFYPGGPLAVAEGDQIVGPIAKWMNEFQLVVCTQDSHPAGHISFASSHGMKAFEALNYDNMWTVAEKSSFSLAEIQTYLERVESHQQVLWPDHCVQGTEGWALDARLPLKRADLILRKGGRREVDSYSGFFENDGSKTGLSAYLHERGVERLLTLGLAGDYCVLWTALDAQKEGFEVFYDPELTRYVDFPKGSRQAAFQALQSAGVQFLSNPR